MNQYNSIQYMNVYSKEYTFPYTKVAEIMHEFQELCNRNQLEMMGNLFYAVKQIDKDGIMTVEYFLPAQNKEKELTGGLKFHSYYVIDQMISMVVVDDIETNMETACAILIESARKNKMKIVSPIYNEVFGRQKNKYVIVKVAVTKENEEHENDE